jgi:mono/diheme cytochrome c family protein
MRGFHGRSHLARVCAGIVVTTWMTVCGAEVPPVATAAPGGQASGVQEALRFDKREKTFNVPSGQFEASFTFAVTNASPTNVTITSVHTSCGCTAARLPANPWILAPGQGGEIGATMSLAGKFGTVIKTVTLVSDAGSFPLVVRAVMPDDAYDQLQRNANRSRNLQVAAADRQAVFRNDCARCHVEPTKGKSGKELYAAACGICHDSPHRASMVPGLRGRPATYPAVYWNQWILHGKEGSLMPAFSQAKGGPLSPEQCESLTAYLTGEFIKEPSPSAPKPEAQPAQPGKNAPVK